MVAVTVAVAVVEVTDLDGGCRVGAGERDCFHCRRGAESCCDFRLGDDTRPSNSLDNSRCASGDGATSCSSTGTRRGVGLGVSACGCGIRWELRRNSTFRQGVDDGNGH